MQEAPGGLPPLVSRGLGLLLLGGLVWYAFRHSAAPLCGFFGIAAALVSIRIGQRGVERYGRRVPVTEMLTLGRQGDRAMLVGGLAGYAMVIFFGLAIYLAW
jgi:hypothetical protein